MYSTTIDFSNINYGISKVTNGTLLVDLAEYCYINKEQNEVWIENFKGKPRISTSKPLDVFCKVLFTEQEVDSIPTEWVYYLNSENIRLLVFHRVSGVAFLFIPYSFKDMEPYTGRQYHLNKNDCYRLVVDFYKKEFNISLGEQYSANMSWMGGGLNTNIKNLLVLNYVKEGFEQVGIPQYGDCLLISSSRDQEYPEHVAIYMENNKILHHYTNRLSTIEEYSSFWKSRTTEYLRHKSKL